jgi:hypothetical protein
MRFAVLIMLTGIPCAALSPDTAPSLKMEKELARIEAQASVRGGAKPELVFDALRLPDTTETDAELLLVLNLARASLAFPIPVVEAEQAAWQRTLLFAVERGAEDDAFGARLAKAVREAGASTDALDRSAPPPRTPWEPAEAPKLKLPRAALARAALLLHLFEQGPERFYWTIEEGTAWPRGSARLSELEDLYALRAREIAALRAAPEGPYATLGGRRYPAALVRAGFLLRGTGQVESLRESLEAYDTVGSASLRIAINRWRRAIGK